MHWGAKRSDTRFIEYLADRGCTLSLPSKDKVGMHPIHWAATESAIPIVSFLLKRGVDINEQDSSGCTPLLVAAQYGHATLVGFLIKRGADTSILDGNQVRRESERGGEGGGRSEGGREALIEGAVRAAGEERPAGNAPFRGSTGEERPTRRPPQTALSKTSNATRQRATRLRVPPERAHPAPSLPPLRPH